MKLEGMKLKVYHCRTPSCREQHRQEFLCDSKRYPAYVMCRGCGKRAYPLTTEGIKPDMPLPVTNADIMAIVKFLDKAPVPTKNRQIEPKVIRIEDAIDSAQTAAGE